MSYEVWKDILQTSFFCVFSVLFLLPSCSFDVGHATQHRAASGPLALHLDIVTLDESTWGMAEEPQEPEHHQDSPY